MHKFNFTEDILAIVIGAGLLLLAAIAWILLPYGAASAEFATAATDAAFDPVTWRPQTGGMPSSTLAAGISIRSTRCRMQYCSPLQR